MAVAENCATCKFSTMTLLQRYYNQETDHWEDEFQHLACRRYPPTMVAEGEGSYPIMVLVHADEWCGEFKEIPSEPVDESYVAIKERPVATCERYEADERHPAHYWTTPISGKKVEVSCPGLF